tara:strand:+ start:1463 stop:1765 length:303 start_codon:yes stop_codon:yes gene_type:complete
MSQGSNQMTLKKRVRNLSERIQPERKKVQVIVFVPVGNEPTEPNESEDFFEGRWTSNVGGTNHKNEVEQSLDSFVASLKQGNPDAMTIIVFESLRDSELG